jgi:hypothetical protein
VAKNTHGHYRDALLAMIGKWRTPKGAVWLLAPHQNKRCYFDETV